MSDSAVPRVRIIHETNPRKYYPAVYRLASQGRITLVGSHRYSVAKEWLRAYLVDRTDVATRTRHAWGDLAFRARVPWVRDEAIILGFAPWSFRMLWYWPLVRRNRIVYHTSWHDWSERAVPRVYGPLTPVLRRLWLRFLHSPNLQAVAVSEVARRASAEATGIEVDLLPHAVPQEFFDSAVVGTRAPGPLRLVFVGELAPKKGVPELLDLMRNWQGAPVHLTVIGAGPLSGTVEAAAASLPAVTYRGTMTDRGALATELASHDVLVLLSQRQDGWEELFGLVIVEAIAAGLGVVATSHVGPRTIFENRDLGNLFDEDDIDGVRTLLTRLAADPAELQRFRDAHAGIAAPFQVDHVADRWARVLGAS